jgi:hypothetical protein
MIEVSGSGRQVGIELAERLGLNLTKHEGHDLAGPCISCSSSDAFRLHMETGVSQCYSCQAKWSPFQLAESVLGNRDVAKSVLIAVGIFTANGHGGNGEMPTDPIQDIARQKGIPVDSLIAFGAKEIDRNRVQLPAYDRHGKQCTTFTMSSKGGKGLFDKGKPAGLFFPHVDGKVRLPNPGETWHLVEGPKDAAALHGLGLLACGINTSQLNPKFARLFNGVDAILVPDRDRAGEDGAPSSARNLCGVARSVRIVVLPAEFKESGGEDVRDILRRPGGRELVLQAIADAKVPDGWEATSEEEPPQTPTTSTAEIALPEGEPLQLEVSAAGREPQRLVVAVRGKVEHRDRINTDSSTSRDRFIKKLGEKLGIDRSVLSPLVDPQLTEQADKIDEQESDQTFAADAEKQSQSTIAANMAVAWELWHTPAKDAFATFPICDHQETWSIRSQTFKRFLAKKFFDETGKAMNSEALSGAVNLIEATALFEGEEHPIHVRVAEHEGKIYLDLCNTDWQVVEITAGGWQILDESPVRFRRSRSMLPLPAPVHGGQIDKLRGFLNFDDDAWRLIVAWLIATFRPSGPYPVLALFAEQGSGKSTTGRLLRDLIDPNSAPLRAEPKDNRDLAIAANNAWCLAYDNLSYIPSWLSDALCRLSTGGGFSTRELYSDQDEIIFDSQRPVMLNSIEEVATRSDLLDRCLVVLVNAIPEDRRRSEAELLAAFDGQRPKLIGALLDGVATALQRLSTLKLTNLPRMADFALWASAAETAFGWEPGTFLRSYHGNREAANEVALEASPVARPLLDLLEEHGSWSASSSELLDAVESRVTEQSKRLKSWPKNGQSMSGHLKRLAPNLRKTGWDVQFHREAKRRWVSIQRQGSSSVGNAQMMQFDADQRDLQADDANDANDAIAQEADWEEGQL